MAAAYARSRSQGPPLVARTYDVCRRHVPCDRFVVFRILSPPTLSPRSRLISSSRPARRIPSVDPLTALFGGLAVVLIVLFAVLLRTTGPGHRGQEIAYSEA